MTSLAVISSILLAVGIGHGTVASPAPDSPLQARLVLPDAKLLPGVPFDMWVELHNPTDTTVTAGLDERVVVSKENGQTFEAKTNGQSSEAARLLDASFVTLQPGETRVIPFAVKADGEGAEFFSDPRLLTPGRYKISMEMDRPSSVMIHSPLTFLGPVTTNEASFERIEPSGSDADVWKLIIKAAGEDWSKIPLNGRLWSEVQRQYPDSNYVPYAVLAAELDPYDQRLADAIERFPTSPVVELLQLRYSWGGGMRNGKPDESGQARANDAVLHSKRPTTLVLRWGPKMKADAPTASQRQ